MILNLVLALGPGGVVAIIAVAVLFFIFLGYSIRIVSQAQAYVIERFGSYQHTWGTGIHFLTPFVTRISKKVSLKEQVVDFEPQPVITKDNVTMQIDTVVFYEITDPKQYTYGVERPRAALEKLTATTLRNIIGDIELDTTLTSRDLINAKMRKILDEATDPWGMKVNRVEVKNILPPKDIRDAMEKQMRAERERRESILRAEGVKQSEILKAEGDKQSKILSAEGAKTAQILAAEGDKAAQILAAEGRAEAIVSIQAAEAKSIEMIRNAKADKAVLTLKGYEALIATSKGPATKIIIPSDLQGVTSFATGIIESLKDPVNKESK
ncbi:MAG: SPFH domain-containing protein [Bacilli bacterium]